MSLRAVLHLLCVFGLFQKGLTELIRTRRTVMAAVGEEVLLNCELLQSKVVNRVTWQKVLSKGEKILASCTKEYCQRMNLDFENKVFKEFIDAGLQNSSIVFRNVTEEDEGCYHCLFTTDPEGDITAPTCLKLYELHEPVLHVRESGSEETVVSCSATGRPAPTVTLTVLRDNVHFPDSVSVDNTNGTVTVTSTAVLTRLQDNCTEVRCAVRVLSAPQKEKVMMIPAEVKQSADGFHEDSGSEITRFTTITTLSVLLSFCCVAAVVTVLLIRRHRNSQRQRDSEEIMMPRKPTEHTQETRTPFIHQDNGQLRRRSPPEKSEGGNSPEPSPGTCRQLFGDTK